MKCHYCGHPATKTIFKKPICPLCRYKRKKLLAELKYHKREEAFDNFILKILLVDKLPSYRSHIAKKWLKIKEIMGLL